MEISTKEGIYRVPLYIAESNIGAREHIPADAEIVHEMNQDPRVILRFGESGFTDVEAVRRAIDPSEDINIYTGLLDPNVSYDESGVLERGLEYKGADGEKNLAGWVALYRTNPARIPRLVKEGILFEQDHVNSTFPTLELSYARHALAPRGIIDGVRAELYRVYSIAMRSQDETGVSLLDRGEEITLKDPSEFGYNDICPLRIILTTDIDNIASARLAEKLGFVLKGQTAFETFDEAEDPDKFEDKQNLFYELDWNIYMTNMKTYIDSLHGWRRVNTEPH